MCPSQVLRYQLTLFGPRGADYARHITTGPPIILDDAVSMPLSFEFAHIEDLLIIKVGKKRCTN